MKHMAGRANVGGQPLAAATTPPYRHRAVLTTPRSGGRHIPRDMARVDRSLQQRLVSTVMSAGAMRRVNLRWMILHLLEDRPHAGTPHPPRAHDGKPAVANAKAGDECSGGRQRCAAPRDVLVGRT